MSKPKKVWSTDTTYYTIVHRKRGERNCYSFGYRSDDRNLLRELAEQEALEGEYRCVKIINADTNEDIEYFTEAHR